MSSTSNNIELPYVLTNEKWASDNLPRRPEGSNKGSFGKALIIAGSDKYRGAAHLALSAALRGGAGYTAYAGSSELCLELRAVYPEAIYVETDYSSAHVAKLSNSYDATLIGSGSDVSQRLYHATLALIESSGTPLVIDADAINAIAKYASPKIFKKACRKIILTPHPLEFSRLSGIPVEKISENRRRIAVDFAREYGVILLLKGHRTVITDGERVFINGSGSPALAKAGSGDVLSGLLTSLLAFSDDELVSVALAAYIHGRAGDNLAEELSTFGVIPSDIPLEAARVIARLERLKNSN